MPAVPNDDHFNVGLSQNKVHFDETAMLSQPAFRCAATLFAFSLMAMQMGCATTATMTALKPAQIDLRGVRQVAVLNLNGPPDVAELAHRTIVSQLETDGGFAVVPSQELERFAPAPLYYENGKGNPTVVLEAAARMRIDAVLIGQLSRRQESMFGPTKSRIQIGDPTVTVQLGFQLIDARTGQVLATGKPEHSYTGELDRYGSDSTSEEAVHGRLASACAQEVVAMIAPHRAPVEVQLADAAFTKGATTIWAGNSLARKGNWKAAMQKWNQAIEENPENDAAAYNLGLAQESMGNFAEATRLYTLAANLAEKDLYTTSLVRAQRAGHEYQLAMAQIGQRRHGLPASPPYSLASLPARSAPGEDSAAYPSPPGPPPWTTPAGQRMPVGLSRSAVPWPVTGSPTGDREMRRLPPE